MEGKKGTTTLGIVCKDGVVLAADRRASLGHLAYDRTEKIVKITKDIGLTIAGSVSDAQVLSKFLTAKMRLYALERGMEPTVDVASSFMANIVYGGSKNFFPYLIMFILAGKGEDGWKMYSMDPSGASVANSYIATGSGMELALGVLEEHYEKTITVEEGRKLAIKAMTSAIRRDIATGEGIDIVVIDKNGYRKVDHKTHKELIRAE